VAWRRVASSLPGRFRDDRRRPARTSSESSIPRCSTPYQGKLALPRVGRRRDTETRAETAVRPRIRGHRKRGATGLRDIPVP
jgi:hypothetical protein